MIAAVVTASAQDYTIHFRNGAYTPATAPMKFAKSKGEKTQGVHQEKTYVLLQFTALPDAHKQSELLTAGVELLDYIPNNAYFAAVSASFNPALAESFGIRSIDSIRAEYKLHQSLQLPKTYPDWAVKATGTVDVIVSHFASFSHTTAIATLTEMGLATISESALGSTVTVRVSPAHIDRIIALNWVRWVEPIASPPTKNNLSGRTSHRSNVLAQNITGARNLQGNGIKIGIWDVGDVGNHVDFNSRVTYRKPGMTQDQHSTHCTGTILGAGIHDPFAIGMAPQATIGSWTFFTNSVAAEEAQAITEQEIMISSHSWGTIAAGSDYGSASRDEDIVVRTNEKFSHIQAAGNLGPDFRTIGQSAAEGSAKNVILVAAIDSADFTAALPPPPINNGRFFSSRGPMQDGRLKPDISSVGAYVYSSQNNHAYATYFGTSMATPGVAGTVAQLYERYRQLNGNTSPDAALIKSVVNNNADDIGNPGPDFTYGYGKINALATVRTMEQNRYTSNNVNPGQFLENTINVPAGAVQLRVMLAWTDKEAVQNSEHSLVNDLDLVVISPNNSQTLPWRLDTANPGNNATRGVDIVNNCEQVTIDNPVSGNYTIRVIGSSVPFGPQKYFVTWSVVTPGIEVTYPNGGESLIPGTSQSIRWSAAGNTGTFTAQYTTNNGTTWNTISSAIPASQRFVLWTVPTVVSAQVKVRVFSGALTDDGDALSSILAVPTGLVRTPSGANTTLTWLPVIGATSYDAMKYNAATNSWETMANVATTSATLTDVTSSMWITVRARGAANAISERATALQGLDIPFLISPANSSTGKPYTINHQWLDVPDATSYRFQLSTVPNFATMIYDATVTATSQIVSGLIGNTTYYWRVRANSATITGDYSAVWSYTTNPTDPSVNLTTYTFSQLSGTYIPFSDGIDDGFNGADEGLTVAALPFPFIYGGIPQTEVSINVNGVLGFGAGYYLDYFPYTGYGNHPYVVAPLWTDMIFLSPGSDVLYKTTGTAPNRIFWVQWRGGQRFGEYPEDDLNFQIKLYETSNRIEFVYGTLTNFSGYPSSNVIGLTGPTDSPSDFISVTPGFPATAADNVANNDVYSDFVAATIAPGTIYRFDPVLPIPTISSFTPTTGASGTTVMISGTRFNNIQSVKFGGTNAASFSRVSATQISAVTGAGTTGTITVTTDEGTATSAGTFFFPNAASDIITQAGFGYSANIPYASYQASDITPANSVAAMGLTIRDGGATTDADGLGTTLTAMSLNLTNPAILRRAALYNGATELAEIPVTGGTLTFTGLTVAVPDNGSVNLTLRVTYQATVTDNTQNGYTVSSVTAATDGSVFASANGGGAASSVTGDNNRIEVTADRLAFAQQPSDVNADIAMSPAPTVRALDANSNTDLDYTAGISVTNAKLTGSPVTVSAVNGVATFSALSFFEPGFNQKLTATSGALTSVQSTIFQIWVRKIVWLQGTSITGVSDGGTLQTWLDDGGNDDNATQANALYRPTYRSSGTWTINSLPTVQFATGKGLGIAARNEVNGGSQKVIFAVFKTGSNTLTRQVIADIGGVSSGFNMYIANSSIYAGAWDDQSTWLSRSIAPNTVYLAQFTYTGSSLNLSAHAAPSGIGTATTVAFGDNSIAASPYGSGIGAASQQSRYHNGVNVNTGLSDPFTGSIAEIIVMNSTDLDGRTQIWDYLNQKYAIGAPAQPIAKYAAEEQPEIQPTEEGELSVYPNPANDEAVLSYVVPTESPIRLMIQNVLGETVAVLYEGTQKEGFHQTMFYSAKLPAGMYRAVLLTPTGSISTQMIIQR